MPQFRIRFRAGNVGDEPKRLATQRLRTVAEFFQAAVKKAISRRLSKPSPPGEPPRRVTGQLHDSIELIELPNNGGFTVGSNSPYAASLEFGTSQMAARPFLRSTLAKSRRDLARLLKPT